MIGPPATHAQLSILKGLRVWGDLSPWSHPRRSTLMPKYVEIPEAALEALEQDLEEINELLTRVRLVIETWAAKS